MTDGRGARLDTVPLDDERGDEVRVWCRFLGQATSQPLRAAQQRLHEQRWRALLTDFMTQGQRCGAVVAGLDAAAEAEALSVVDGISLHAVFEPERFPADHQMRLLDRHLARLVAHPTGNVGADDTWHTTLASGATQPRTRERVCADRPHHRVASALE